MNTTIILSQSHHNIQNERKLIMAKTERYVVRTKAGTSGHYLALSKTRVSVTDRKYSWRNTKAVAIRFTSREVARKVASRYDGQVVQA